MGPRRGPDPYRDRYSYIRCRDCRPPGSGIGPLGLPCPTCGGEGGVMLKVGPGMRIEVVPPSEYREGEA